MAAQSNTRIIVVIALIAIGGLVVFLLSSTRELRWSETYRPDDKNPYGASVFYTLLGHAAGPGGLTKITDTLAHELPDNPTLKIDNYVFIGHTAYLDSADTEKLIRFLRAGNRVFFITTDIGNRLLDSLVVLPEELERESAEVYLTVPEEETYPWIEDEIEDEYEYADPAIPHFFNTWDSIAYVGLNGLDLPDARLDRLYQHERMNYDWTSLNVSLQGRDGRLASHLGYLNKSDPNFISVPFEKGTIYIHTTPLAFTNYHLMNDTVHQYARSAMHHLGNGSIYWDEENRTFDWKAFHRSATDMLPDEGALEFILSERTLRTAWYLLLAGGLLYLIFGARRKQRIIPIRDNVDNTSIEYAEVISQLFMKQSDHTKLIELKMELFRSHLRDRFMIKLPAHQEDTDDAFFLSAASRSGVDEALIRSIFKTYSYLSIVGGVNTQQMLEFHHLIEQFHQHSK